MPPSLPVQTTTVCITPEQAAKGPAELLEQPGRLHWQQLRRRQDRKRRALHAARRHAEDQQMEMTGKTAMSQKARVEGRRIGECEPK